MSLDKSEEENKLSLRGVVEGERCLNQVLILNGSYGIMSDSKNEVKEMNSTITGFDPNWMYPKILIPTNGKIMWRKGKWTEEEELYTKKIIDAFNTGHLKLPIGTTLRSYLAHKLCCDPMRITKKFSGSSCIGKQVYSQIEVNLDPNETKRIEEELLQLEKSFLEKVDNQTCKVFPAAQPPLFATTFQQQGVNAKAFQFPNYLQGLSPEFFQTLTQHTPFYQNVHNIIVGGSQPHIGSKIVNKAGGGNIIRVLSNSNAPDLSSLSSHYYSSIAEPLSLSSSSSAPSYKAQEVNSKHSDVTTNTVASPKSTARGNLDETSTSLEQLTNKVFEFSNCKAKSVEPLKPSLIESSNVIDSRVDTEIKSGKTDVNVARERKFEKGEHNRNMEVEYKALFSTASRSYPNASSQYYKSCGSGGNTGPTDRRNENSGINKLIPLTSNYFYGGENSSQLEFKRDSNHHHPVKVNETPSHRRTLSFEVSSSMHEKYPSSPVLQKSKASDNLDGHKHTHTNESNEIRNNKHYSKTAHYSDQFLSSAKTHTEKTNSANGNYYANEEVSKIYSKDNEKPREHSHKEKDGAVAKFTEHNRDIASFCNATAHAYSNTNQSESNMNIINNLKACVMFNETKAITKSKENDLNSVQSSSDSESDKNNGGSSDEMNTASAGYETNSSEENKESIVRSSNNNKGSSADMDASDLLMNFFKAAANGAELVSSVTNSGYSSGTTGTSGGSGTVSSGNDEVVSTGSLSVGSFHKQSDPHDKAIGVEVLTSSDRDQSLSSNSDLESTNSSLNNADHPNNTSADKKNLRVNPKFDTDGSQIKAEESNRRPEVSCDANPTNDGVKSKRSSMTTKDRSSHKSHRFRSDHPNNPSQKTFSNESDPYLKMDNSSCGDHSFEVTNQKYYTLKTLQRNGNSINSTVSQSIKNPIHMEKMINNNKATKRNQFVEKHLANCIDQNKRSKHEGNWSSSSKNDPNEITE